MTASIAAFAAYAVRRRDEARARDTENEQRTAALLSLAQTPPGLAVALMWTVQPTGRALDGWRGRDVSARPE